MFNWTTRYFYGHFEQLCESARGYRIFHCDEFVHWLLKMASSLSHQPRCGGTCRVCGAYSRWPPTRRWIQMETWLSASAFFFWDGSHRWNHRFCLPKKPLTVQFLPISRKHCHGTAVCWWERAVEISGNSLVHRDLLDGPLQFWLQHLLTWDSGVQPVTWWWLVPNFRVRGPLLIHLKRWDCAL